MVPWMVVIALAHGGELHLCAHEAVSQCRTNCEAGHALSCARYAHQLTYGVYDRLDKDREEAGKVWKQACDLGWAAGCNRLGRLYDDGKDGFPRDVAKANALYEKACGMNDASACWNLGVGFDDAGNLAKAKALYEKACTLGASDACLELGAMYEVGDGVQKSWDKMWDHYARAFFAPSETQTAAVGCPEGTRTYRQEASFGWEIEVFCAKPGGRRPTKHGPYLRWATEEDEAEGLPHGVITRRGTYTEGKKSGHWVTFDERGRKQKEGPYVADKEHGEWKKYDPESGRLVETIPYEDGKRTGAVEESTYGGGKRVGAYVDGKKDGKWVEVDANGMIEKEETYAMGKRVGSVFRYHDGKKTHETPYDDDGKPHGTERAWHPDATLASSTEWTHGERNGTHEAFNREGRRVRLETWKDGRLDGPYEQWSYDGKHLLLKGTANGERDTFRGPFTQWDEQTFEKIEEGTFDDESRAIGTWTFWHADGTKDSVITYGEPDCVTREVRLRPNGKPATKGDYVDCERHGPWVEYHDNGKVESEGTYTHGNRTGEWATYFENGKPYRKGRYDERGYETGEWTEWFDCGHERAIGSYSDEGYRIGRWTEWDYEEPHTKRVYQYDADGNRTEVESP